MPTYVFRCGQGHVTEVTTAGMDGATSNVTCRCDRLARRVWTPIAHIPTEGMYAHDSRNER